MRLLKFRVSLIVYREGWIVKSMVYKFVISGGEGMFSGGGVVYLVVCIF